jgi:biotin operon repressor
MKGQLLQHWHCDACGAAACTANGEHPPSGWLFQHVGDHDVHACSEDCARALVGVSLLGWRVSANPAANVAPHVDVPDWALRMPELNRATIPTYVLLCKLGASSPSMAELAQHLRIDRKTAIRHVRHLERIGLVRVTRRQVDGRHLASAYEVVERGPACAKAKMLDA